MNCVCHSIRSMFRVLGIYNFAQNGQMIQWWSNDFNLATSANLKKKDGAEKCDWNWRFHQRHPKVLNQSPEAESVCCHLCHGIYPMVNKKLSKLTRKRLVVQYHGSYKWIIMLEKCGRPDLNVFYLKWIIGTHENCKDPGGCFWATS